MARDMNGLGILPFGDRVYIVVGDTPIHALSELQASLQSTGMATDILHGFDEGPSLEGEEANVMLEAVTEIHMMDCVEAVSPVPKAGVIVLLSEMPTSREMDAFRENVNLYGSDGKYHRFLLILGKNVVEVIEVNKNTLAPKYEKPLALNDRPERDIMIQKDEITNLRISLETSRDVNDFLKSLEG